MADLQNDNPALEPLAAFADAELDGAQSQAVAEQMARDPRATRAVLHQQQLRQAADRAFRTGAPPMPADLRARIEKLAFPSAETTPPAFGPTSPSRSHDERRPRPRGPFRLPSVLRWATFAAAAAVVAVAVMMFAFPGPHASAQGAILKPEQVRLFTARHVSCSRQISKLLQDVKTPGNLKEMPAFVGDFLGHQTYPVLDLSPLGYDFAEAGHCIIPGPKSVHLIYKRRTGDTDGHPEAISLWIAPDNGSVKIAADKPYTILGRGGVDSFIVWRHADMVYYLVADSFDDAEGAVKLLNSRN